MKRDSLFVAAAVIGYVVLIGFVRLHPTGRDVDMLDFTKHRPTAVVTSLCMLGVSAAYLYGKKVQGGGKTLRIGCLGMILAFVIVMILVFVNVTPDTWFPLESQLFIRNLVTVMVVPFGIVFVFGVGRLRVEGAQAKPKTRP